MLIDRYLPRSDMASRHETVVQAPPEVTYRAARELDLSNSPLSTVLFALRAVPRLLTGAGGPPATKLTFEALEEAGFVVLGEQVDEELVFGVVGRFWTPNSGIRPIEPDRFTTFDEPGYAKAAMNIRVWPHPDGSRITTETRVLCTDAGARRKFKLYWALIGRFSGFIRGEMLRTIKGTAEREARATAGV